MLSAFFSGTETALTTVNMIRIRSLAEEGNPRAKRLMRLHEHSAKMLSSILIGNNIVNISASALATTIALDIGLPVGFMTLFLTVILLIFGEITPKNAAAVYSEQISLALCGLVWILMQVLTPVIWIIDLLSKGLLWILHIDLSKANKATTENELRTFVDVSHEDGVIERSEKKIINNVVDFGDSRARDIMIPRIDVTEVDIGSTYDEIARVFQEDKYSRIPVYAESTDNVVGVLHMKDVFFSDKESFKVRDVMREGYYTYELKRTSELLLDMKKSSVTMAIVLNEYGSTVGIITMEDLLEEIVGEIRDEYDEDEVDIIQQINDQEFDVDASVKLDDLNDALGTDFHSEDYDSLGGFIIEKLDHLPVEGETVETEDGIMLEVLSVAKNRVIRVDIRLPKPAEPDKV
ncbi:MAG: hemolysin family protein [Lachnospiraceae bacterium]|nr:hemolysin family protein [Lachnospiraceae bacterium]